MIQSPVIGIKNFEANGFNYETKIIFAVAGLVWLVGWVVAVLHFIDKGK